MSGIGEIRPRMAVVGADGEAVGEVDRLENGWIHLRRGAAMDDGGAWHHALPLDCILRVEGNRVWVVLPARQARVMAMGEATAAPSA